MPLTKTVFYTQDGLCLRQVTRYEWFAGGNTDLEEKQNRVKSLHNNFNLYRPDFKLLEISSISPQPLGVQVSGLRLRDSKGNLIEGVYKGSIDYEGGQLEDLYYVETAREALTDKRGHELGLFSHYNLYGKRVPTEPITLMRYWLWCDAVYSQKNLLERVLEYNGFTTYFSRPSRDYFGTYPEAASLLVALNTRGTVDEAMKNIESFALHAYGVEIQE